MTAHTFSDSHARGEARPVDGNDLALCPLTMSSLEIAGLTRKRHDHVTRDIRKMLEDLGDPSPQFWGKVPSVGGRPMDVAYLPKRETIILVSGYSTEMRARIIDRWMQLEAALASPSREDPELSRAVDDEKIAAIATAVFRAMAPEIMKASLANGARNVRGWLLAVQVADNYGVLAKGRGKFVQRVSSRLKKFCEERGWAMQAEYREDGKQPRRMFSVEAVAAWARQEGLAIVTMHLAKQPFARPAPEGQGVLPFVRQPKK